MPRLAQTSLLDELAEVAEDNLADAATVRMLKTDALTWKPDPDRWSIAECFEHLNILNRHYVDHAARVLNDASAPSQPPATYRSGVLGERLVRAVHPSNIAKAVKTPSAFDPAQASLDGHAVIDEYIERATTFRDLLETARRHDLGALRVPSSITRLVRLKLGDVLRTVAYHDRRHLIQVQHVRDQLPVVTK